MTGKVIYSLLSGNSHIRAVVGDKIFPNVAKQGAKIPFITYSLIYSDPHDDKDGPCDLDVERWQISCFSDNYSIVSDLNKKVRTVLERYVGTVEGVVVQSVAFLGTQDLFEEDALDKGVHHKATDYSFRIKL